MTESEPIAYGICGLMPEEFRKLTPAEFRAIVNAKIKYRDQEREFIDARHGYDCAIAVQLQCPDARPTAGEFMLIKPAIKTKPDPAKTAIAWTQFADTINSIGGNNARSR